MSEISKQALKVDNSQSFPNNNIGAISPSDLRAFNVNMIDSLVDEITYNVDSASWNNSISALNTFSASQQPSFNALNSFTASQLSINSGVNGFTQSANASINNLTAEVDQLQTWSGSVNAISDNGVLLGYSTRLNFYGLMTASVVQNVGGPIAAIGLLSDTTRVSTSSFNEYTTSVNDSLNELSSSYNPFSASQNSFNQSATASISQLLSFSSSLDATYATDAQLNLSSSILQNNINTLSSFTGSYATTGSNVFTGDQTLIDASGNSITLSDASGSLFLVAKGFTSASLHLSASAAGIGNLIFKNNNNTPDTIISGSSNIFVNPAAPTAGFKRYIGTSNIYTQPNSVPQISGSVAFSPTMLGNIVSSQGNAITLRAPVSSSTYTMTTNILMGGGINLGTSAANNFEKAVSGVSIIGNALFGGNLNMVANTTTLVNTVNASNNLLFGSLVTLNHISSSLSYNSNIQNGAFTVNNRFTPAAGTVVAALSPRSNTNTIYGTGHVLNIDGTNVSTSQTKQHNFNLYAGTFLTASIGDGDNSGIIATSIMGNALVVTGSTLPGVATAETIASTAQGSLFTGRFNAQDGNKAKTAETIFAVGTGTSYTNRKTGFLIDSGSNTIIEGSLTITGSVYGNVSASSITSQTASIDLSVANYFTLTLSGSTNINVLNPKAGNTAILRITTDASPSVTFSSNVLQPTGSIYSPTAGANNIDILTLTAFDTSTVYVIAANQFK